MVSIAHNTIDVKALESALMYSLAVGFPALILAFLACFIFGTALVKLLASSFFLIATVIEVSEV